MNQWQHPSLQLKRLFIEMRAAQQSVQWTVGILRHFQVFFWHRVFSAPKQNPRPPHRR
jgi:hypothetical protein